MDINGPERCLTGDGGMTDCRCLFDSNLLDSIRFAFGL